MNGTYPYVIAVSVYSEISAPTVEWTQERMCYVTCFLPMAGVMRGLVVEAWFYVGLDVFGFAPWATALVGTCVPVLAAGGIRMDGFLDTVDASHSYGGRPKKLEILKGPHLGAFAIISTAIYMILYLRMTNEYALLLASRQKGAGTVLRAVPPLFFATKWALSGLSVVWFPPAKRGKLAAGFARAPKEKLDRLVLVLRLVLCTALAVATCLTVGKEAGILAASVGGVQLLVFGWYYRTSVRESGGITGDLVGYFLQICKLASFQALIILIRTGGFAL